MRRNDVLEDQTFKLSEWREVREGSLLPRGFQAVTNRDGSLREIRWVEGEVRLSSPAIYRYFVPGPMLPTTPGSVIYNVRTDQPTLRVYAIGYLVEHQWVLLRPGGWRVVEDSSAIVSWDTEPHASEANK